MRDQKEEPPSVCIRFDTKADCNGGGEPSEETGVNSWWQENSGVCGSYDHTHISGYSGEESWCTISERAWNTWLQVASYI